MATIATTPLWVYILKRPKVSFAKEPLGWCSYRELQEKQQRKMEVVIEMELVNDGNEESNLLDIQLELWGGLGKGGRSFSPALVSPSLLSDHIAGNGGRLAYKLVYVFPEPEPYKMFPHSRKLLPPFIQGRTFWGTLKIYPSQNKRLLWGHKKIEMDVEFEWLT